MIGDRVSVNLSMRSFPDIGTPGTLGRISLVSCSFPPVASAYESMALSTAPASSEVAVSSLPAPAGRIWKVTFPVVPPCARGAIEAFPSAVRQLSSGPNVARALTLEPFASRLERVDRADLAAREQQARLHRAGIARALHQVQERKVERRRREVDLQGHRVRVLSLRLQPRLHVDRPVEPRREVHPEGLPSGIVEPPLEIDHAPARVPRRRRCRASEAGARRVPR